MSPPILIVPSRLVCIRRSFNRIAVGFAQCSLLLPLSLLVLPSCACRSLSFGPVSAAIWFKWTSRHRSADDIEQLLRLNWGQGTHKFFITDDNFARNKNWESIFDRFIQLREIDGIPIGLMIQVDTLCHKIPRFITKRKEPA